MYKRIGWLLIVICELVSAAVLCCVQTKLPRNPKMQSSTIIVLACLVAAVAASVHYDTYPAEEVQNVQDVHESLIDTPEHERSARTKRGLLLLKKKLLLGALGLKAAKVGVGAGVVGALALKKHQSVPTKITVQSARWSG
ncbi:uncharacterized protein LOC112043015 isoform X2 [Bicyclus anynana]|uniref:Uncharacterized protein LOC112043015 isoform X2 n=1 Tax=Bicyclus anynana TaxID=110368 RepID=A0A6J1MM47_BICAN|nr:uncharacterized protein LOC112043015 isoform X2 [Bicyclus anynana]